jgi:hypothetical protein
MRMVLEHPNAELAPHFRLADALDDFHSRIAKDAHSFAVNPRVRIAHAKDDARDAALGDGSRARRCAPVKRARLEGRV